MIEFTGVDPYTYRFETWLVAVLLEHVSHVTEYTGRETKCGAIIHMMNGTKVYVAESYAQAKKRLDEAAARPPRDSSEGAQE